MKIDARKVAPDVYQIDFDDTEVVLEGSDLKALLLQVMKVLAPAGSTKKEEEKSKEFVRHIKNANDMGIQKLLLVAEHEDVLVLLKTAEEDDVLTNKFFSNMSDNNRKMFEEDLNYKFKDKLPAGRTRKAMTRLMAICKELEADESLVYENVMSR
ncbi:MAG: hypothetical protein HQ504_06920 [Rhodospirillaceae bacterium]|nr:hypothetical protein [Rhodospirillaceae bacterium]